MSAREERIHAPRAEPSGNGLRGQREQLTIRDAARLAGVSIGTAST